MSAPEPQMAPHDAISECAAEFFERRHFGRWSDTDQAELESWFAQSILHEVAYLRVEGIIAHTEELAALRPFKKADAPEAREKSAIRRFAIPFLIAASIAALAAAGVPLVNYLTRTPDRAFSTDVGGRSLVKFADGTEIELNTDTAMRFRMTSAERTVWLQKGEAWFRVAHNAANPFTVIIGSHRVTDLGTEFLVRRGAGAVEVSLLNGRAMLNTEGTPSTMLRPGDEAVATSMSVSVTRKTPQELADELAWRRGVLVFRNTPLAEAVREFNRYNQTKLVIVDPSIATLKFSAELKNDNLQGFLQLAPMLKLRADWQGTNILLSRELPEPNEKNRVIKRRS